MQDTNPNRIQTMEGLRGLAVTLVFLVHYNTLFSAWLEPNSATWHSAKFITSIGRIGVDLFLAITGYLIYGAVIKCILHYHLFFWRKQTTGINLRKNHVHPTKPFPAAWCIPNPTNDYGIVDIKL